MSADPSFPGDTSVKNTTITILDQRGIEARFAAALLPELTTALGREGAAQLLASAASRMAREHARQLASERGFTDCNLQEMAELLPLWEKDGALEVTYLEKGAGRLAFDVTRCRYAEMYESLGMRELGSALSCGRDGAFCQGFNRRIRFTRTQTLMQGASHCDFRYEDPDHAGQ